MRYKADPKAKKVQANWMPAVFQIVPEGFSDKDGTVNSTMKLVRHRVVELHRGPARLLLHRRGIEDRQPAQPRDAARDVQAGVDPRAPAARR